MQPEETSNELFARGVDANLRAVRRLARQEQSAFLTEKDGYKRKRSELATLDADRLGFLDHIALAILRSRREERRQRISELKVAIRRHKKEGGQIRQRLRLLEQMATKMKVAGRACASLGYIPKSLWREADAAANRAIHSAESRHEITIDMVTANTDRLAEVVTAWATSVKLAEEKRDRHADRSKSRIWLPIPRSMENEARRKGGGIDPTASGSRAFVTLEDNLPDFERMLPLAFRNKSPILDFPPVAPAAAHQNLRHVFDPETWTHIRKTNYEHTGYRCRVCGGRHGKLLDRLGIEREGRSPVECHEVWDWKIVDHDAGIGVQTLREILVVCTDCHMMFHEGYAKLRAREHGHEDSVADFIRRKQMLVNKMDEHEIAHHLDEARRRYNQVDGIRSWVVDLGRLSAQDYMKDFEPVFVSDNKSGTRPEMIAGISFVDDRGRSFPSMSADEIINIMQAPNIRRFIA